MPDPITEQLGTEQCLKSGQPEWDNDQTAYTFFLWVSEMLAKGKS